MIVLLISLAADTGKLCIGCLSQIPAGPIAQMSRCKFCTIWKYLAYFDRELSTVTLQLSACAQVFYSLQTSDDLHLEVDQHLG